MGLRNADEEYVRIELCLEGKVGELVDVEAMAPVANFFCCGGGEGEEGVDGREGGLLEILSLLRLEVTGQTMKDRVDELEIVLIRAEDVLGGSKSEVEWGGAESAELEQVAGKVRERQC